jgi:hypothetical protein
LDALDDLRFLGGGWLGRVGDVGESHFLRMGLEEDEPLEGGFVG